MVVAKLEFFSVDIHTFRVCHYSIMGTTILNRRLNITLPERTLRMIDHIAVHGDRSKFIDAAVKHYIDTIGLAQPKKRLKDGAIQRTDRDLAFAADWFTLDEEAWQHDTRT